MAPSRPPPQPTTIENLPGELLSDILIRVPARTLAQMRSVSKPFNAFLSQPSFIKSHLNRSIHNNDEILLVLLSGTDDGDYLSVTAHLSRSPHLDFPNFIRLPDNPQPNPDNTTFFGSVNGLICFGFRTPSDFVIQIWNPSLSAVLTLPPFNGLDWFLIDDSTHQLHFRFGYDPKTDDYKVVKLMSYSKSLYPSGPPYDPPLPIPAKRHFVIAVEDLLDVEDFLEVEVYSMRKGSWKLITDRLPSHVRYINDTEIVCVDGHDGHLHWLGYILSGKGGLQTIVTFDLGVETFGEICLPSCVVDYSQRFWGGLGVYSGKLCVMSFYKGYDPEVWVMNEYGVAESWMKLHIFSHLSGQIDPYGFTSTNKFLFITFIYDPFKTYSDHLEFYDPDSEKVISFKIDARESQYTKIVEYVESLVWVAPTDPAWHQPSAECALKYCKWEGELSKTLYILLS